MLNYVVSIKINFKLNFINNNLSTMYLIKAYFLNKLLVSNLTTYLIKIQKNLRKLFSLNSQIRVEMIDQKEIFQKN